MSQLVETAWVKPPHQIAGLDHLGVQAPCIHIYGQLLPGITNVTDRARYYSFYPWLLSRFEKAGWRDEEKMLTMLRRAECLLTMVSLQHEHQLQDGTDDHRAAMVGVDTLVKAIARVNQGEQIAISEYSDLEESENRYFANPVGGLGQYYFGALWGLGLLDGDSPRGMRLPKGTGTVIADMVERHIPGDIFMNALSANLVDKTVLDELSSFCSCKLKDSAEECEALIGVMLKGWTVLNPDEVAAVEEVQANTTRAHSLAYLCVLADSACESKQSFGMPVFRAMSYTGFDATGQRLPLPDSLSTTENHWKVYQRNELVSISLQGLLFSSLRAAELDGSRFSSTKALSDWFWEEGAGAEVVNLIGGEGVSSDWMVKLAEKLPHYSDWTHAEHETQCMERISHSTNKQGVSQSQLFGIVRDSLSVLASVLCRDENKEVYSDVKFPEGYLQYYPVNLASIRTEWNEQLSVLSVKQALSLFVKNSCLDTHLRVAMRKLRQQGRNTFRFEPTEIGINIKAIPRAAHTTPRFKQAVRILMDLGILEKEQSLLRTTQRGKVFVEDAL